MAGEIEVIAKIKPKNDAFTGIADASQVLVETAGFVGNLAGVTGVAQDVFQTIDGLDLGGGGGIPSFGIRLRSTNGVFDTSRKFYRAIPAACTITGWTLVGNTSGSFTVNVNKCTYAEYPTTASITGGNPPALASATKATDQTLTGWTTALLAGDIIEFSVGAYDGIVQEVMLDIQVLAE